MTEDNKNHNGADNSSENGKENTTDTLLEFPCRFPIKILCNPNKGIEEFVMKTLHDHVEDNKSIDLSVKESKNGKYISITAIFTATSKDQLDTLYTLFSKKDDVHMVL
ncbi:MAG: DUF493 domain-containing protein [Gammaproteobacteria bacterium]|nr:MAG: DUF493 domain-containing protein [Gammaproteobacteria bacterium]UTW41681.1 DUF493 domain-containing protein [bacterium SCSIO 12844]